MPHLVAHTVQADTVKKGDVMGGRTVATRKSGPKWTELRDADGSLILRTLSSDQLAVRRPEDTEEEKAAKAAEYEATVREENNKRIEQWVTKTVDGYADRMHGFVNDMLERFSSYSSYDNMLEAEAEVKIARSIKHVWETSRSEDRNRQYWDEVGEVDWVKAYELWAEGVKERLLDRWSSRALSRSTSVMSNIVEDVERSITLQVLDAMRYSTFRL